MTLATGTRLGPYEIGTALGAGGMGEVYRARDTKLIRDVALKVLPEGFAEDPDRLARFKREAQVLAALNHPHIAAIYGFEDSGYTHALVLELVEGPTLADRIARGPIPLDDALPVARQVAEALEAAHERAIVHRDLKPANIKLRPDGTVKILDFGLAKAFDPLASAVDLSQSPTLTSPAMTRVGTILGTAAYMSPEQARGRAVDKRSDIWAFGCVLYEMLTGRRAFGGDDVTDTIAGIIRGEPDWRALPPETPPSIRRLLRRSLEKDQKERLPDAGSARLEIQDALAAPAETLTPAAVASPPRPSPQGLPYGWIAAAVFFVTTLAVLAVLYVRAAPAATPAYRASILPPDKIAWATATPATRFTVSPDGKRLAFLATSADGQTRLWVRSLDALTAQPLSGTEGVITAFWSHDSRSLAFGAGGKLKRVDASGGPPVTLADMSANQNGTWNQDDVLLFPVSAQAPLSRIAAAGGTPSLVTALDTTGGEAAHWQPFFLPDGRHYLYHVVSSKTAPSGAIYLGSLDPAEKRRLLLQGGSNAQYAMGYLLFMRDTTLMAQRFDPDRLQVMGDVVPVAEQLQVGGSTGRTGAFSVSQTGVLVYQTGESGTASRLVWYDRSGKELAAVGEPGDYGDLELSPDGKRAAVSLLDPAKRTRDIWLFELARGLRTRFTFDAADDLTAVWSPDGSQIVFNSRSKGPLDLYEKPSSGAGNEQALITSGRLKIPTSWSPDGRFLIYSENAGSAGLWFLPMTDDRSRQRDSHVEGPDRRPSVFLQTPFNEGQGRFSPDGRWVAYTSNESGRAEVYVTPFPGKTGKWQVSKNGGTFPRWRHDGRELFYLAPDGKLMAAAVGGQGSGFDVGAVNALFDTRVRTNLRYAYDVAADGQHFLVNTSREETSVEPLTLVVNWAASLRK